MDRRIIGLYDEYTHASLDRRVFLERLASLAGGMSAALALVPLLQPNVAAAAQVPEDDDRLHCRKVDLSNDPQGLRGYLAAPRKGKKWPAVLVIHENRGLNPHVEDVTRRLGIAGYFALAPDFLSALGGTPSDEDQARELIGKLNADQVLSDAMTAAAWLRDSTESTGHVGAVGFCWGGGLVGRLATADENLNAAVVFYGRVPPLEDVSKIKASLLLHYAGLDNRIDADLPAFRKALDDAHVRYQLYMYENVDHAFHNDTSAARYNAAAATLAWQRTLDFFAHNLK
ncbi:MAG TPA: dienelactone hydrolase family protein [Steroidobacteraceae bacterium]|nr:dienelactone hydrolase family protein [Steroidobacteraceae bacterium]